jgi:hypothetical protein
MGQARGTAGHHALGVWYKERSKIKTLAQLDKASKKVLDAAWDKFQEEYPEADTASKQFESLEEALTRYVDWSFNLHNDDIEIITAEYKFEAKIGRHLLGGYIDGVVRYKKEVWLLENKFLKRVQTSNLAMDPQVSTYMLGAYLCGYSPIGVIYNIIRMETKIALKEPVVRSLQYRSIGGLTAKQVEIEAQADEIEDFLEKGGAIYRNETMDCSWDCPFYEVCLSITDSGSDEGMLAKFERRIRENG